MILSELKKRFLQLPNKNESFELLKGFEFLGKNQNLVSPGLAIKSGGTSPQFLTGAITYVIGGVMYQKIAVAANSLTSAISWTGVAATYNAGAYVVCIDNTGTYQLVTTNVTSNTTSAAAAVQGLQWPSIPDGYCVVGIILVAATTANTTFTGGTTNLDAAGITTTYINITGPFYPTLI